MIRKFCETSIALILLLLISPLALLIACSIYLTIGTPVLFRQERTGLNGRIFKILKFRTMTTEVGSNEELRITRLGAFLRKTSLDEIPQLLNIINGDMSFVGPRPLLPKYAPLYSAEQNKRHLVKPGITGWSQVNGRNNLSWNEKLALDVWYVDRKSFILDLKIIFLTILKVLSCKDINQEGHATMEEFKGNN